MQCVNVRGDSTHHRYTLRRLVSQIQGVFCEFDLRGVQIGFAKVKGVICEITVNRVHVDFIKVQGFFCKISIHKVGEPFCKIAIHGLQVDFTKVWEGFCKIYIPSGRRILGDVDSPRGRECTRISRKDLKLYFVIKKIPGVEFFHTGPLSLED